MPMLADVLDAVVGVDTHRDTHEAEIAHPSGAPIARCRVSNDSGGYAELLGWIVEHAPGPRVVVAVEGTATYGAPLTRALHAAGMRVLEAEQPTARSRRGRGKSDPIDAHLAVLATLRRDAEHLPEPRRGDGDREALRILLSARGELTAGVTAATNRLKALLRIGDDTDRALARGALGAFDLDALVARELPGDTSRLEQVRHHELRRLALALRATRGELKNNQAELAAIVGELAPGLTDHVGVGPVSAAQVVVAWSHPGRCRDDAAFAALAGASPLPASSGRTTRHRLNRGGDRQLNRALHTIATYRMTHCPTTRDYVARRTALGKTKSEIRRCLKRYIARRLHRTLSTTMT